MNHQAKQLSSQFMEQYPNVTVQLEILPTERESRTLRLEEIRQKMAEGNGPDVFLLPTGDTLTLEEPIKYTYAQIQPVFDDVTKAMQDGYFADISQYYDADASLEKAQLHAEVMDAGVLAGSRYTLPLRFDAPVLYVWDDYFSEHQVDANILEEGISSWMAYLAGLSDPVLACGGEYLSIQAFSQVLDYDSNCVILDQETLSEYLRLTQQIQAIIGTAVDHRSSASLELYSLGIWEPIPVQVNTLGNSLTYAAIAKAEGRALAMYPIRSVEGDSIATVKYFAAVGADCQVPEIAYVFIRQFLLEDWQWERSRQSNGSGQYSGLIERSMPVRIYGCVEPLWENVKAQQGGAPFESISLTQEDIPLLYSDFDITRHPVPSVFDSIGTQLNDYAKGNVPTDVDIDLLAQSVLDRLEEISQ